MSYARQTWIAAATALVLAGCGGGGGGSTGGQATTPVTPVVDVNLQATTAPVATYAAASGNLAVYGAVNTVRGAVGSGVLAQSAALDQAALAHWNYMNTDDVTLLKSHGETAGVAGFTGADPTARALAAGYQGAVGEAIVGQNAMIDAWDTCLANWTNSVYHVAVLFTSARDIGLAAGTTKAFPAYGKYTVCVMETGVASTAAEQLPVEGTVRVYPYAGQTGVPVVFLNHNESPTPLPAYAELGAPVSLNFRAKPATTTAPVITIAQLTLTPSAGGAAVDARILVNGITSTGPMLTGDGNQDVYTASLVPVARLAPGTQYTVVFAGTVNGRAAGKTWSFTTAP